MSKSIGFHYVHTIHAHVCCDHLPKNPLNPNLFCIQNVDKTFFEALEFTSKSPKGYSTVRSANQKTKCLGNNSTAIVQQREIQEQ